MSLNSLENSLDDAEVKVSGNRSTMAAHLSDPQVIAVVNCFSYIYNITLGGSSSMTLNFEEVQ